MAKAKKTTKKTTKATKKVSKKSAEKVGDVQESAPEVVEKTEPVKNISKKSEEKLEKFEKPKHVQVKDTPGNGVVLRVIDPVTQVQGQWVKLSDAEVLGLIKLLEETVK